MLDPVNLLVLERGIYYPPGRCLSLCLCGNGHKLNVDVLVAIVTTIGVIGAAVLPGYISTRKKAQTINEKIGEPNGHGSIVNMLDEILDLVRDHSNRITRIEQTINDNRNRDNL